MAVLESELDTFVTEDTADNEAAVDSEVDREAAVDREADIEADTGDSGVGATPDGGTTGVTPLSPSLKRKPIPTRATVAPPPA